MDKMLINCISHFIAVSKSVKNNYIMQGISSAKISVVYNGVDLEKFKKSKKIETLRNMLCISDTNSLCIATAGRLIERKGIDIFIKAFSQLSKNSNNLYGLVIGDGPMMGCLKMLARELKIDDKILFTGQVINVHDYLLACDVVVQPSIWPDPFARTIIEAMALGKPVIGSRIGGVTEAIEDGVTGILFSPGDYYALSSALNLLLKNKELREKMGKKAIMRTRKLFSIEQYIEGVDKIYNNVLR
ncbi:MAG: hypothetical protein A2Y62_01860 [Candidatus Fischerbacteria bacterium RBG_13_37_8]|uniref:Glycosyl transferase family 1 domain-containing protein n=1 Tax=Candidatus Fischerbacteria bacterium RBG_13_37_8 TaxID=1817863 RepID=A0A1F5VDM7_9BACT|nr:MAG: hypothetical protein A2Y62_01860 [Candidatus Fischerbacteria bacterium RBG_13_37_8]